MNKQVAIRPIPSSAPALLDPNLGSGYSHHQDDVRLREYWLVIQKYKGLVSIIIGISVLLSLVLAFTVTPRYTAMAKLRISVYQPALASTRVEDVLEERSKDTTYFETQLNEITSLSLADRVLDDTQIRDHFSPKDRSNGLFSAFFASQNSEYQADPVAGYHFPVKMLQGYLEAVKVDPVRRTSLVVIKTTARNAELAARMANRHATEYIDWVRDKRIETQSQGLVFLRGQAEELRERVGELEREMADYAEANSIVAVNKDENITVQKMSQLNKLLTEATGKRIETENNYKQAASGGEVSNTAFDDPAIQQTRSELSKLEAEYQQLGAKFTSSYPRMQQLAAQISGLKNSLNRHRQSIIEGLRIKAESAIQEEKRLKEELEKQTSQAFELSKSQVRYNVLKRELATSRDLLQNVLKQIKETGLAVESNASNVSIIDNAVVPMYPSFPKKKLFLLFGIVGGTVLAVVIVFTINYLDNSVRTPEDLTQSLSLPCLGVVPSFQFEPKLIGNNTTTTQENEPDDLGLGPDATISENSLVPTENLSSIMFIQDPKSLAAEAYRTIRTGILLSQAGEPPRTMLVTSAQSGEGKTTSSVNLAAGLASAGGRVVIVDADLRRPSVSKYFNLPPGLPGLVEIITGQATISEVSKDDIIRRVTIIPSGKIPPNPAELLGSPEMVQIIDDLVALYDYVIIDSPPILPVTDSVILSRYVDGVVLVVKGAATPKKVVKDARDRLISIGARVLGVVLNDVDITSGDYYYYNRYYHSYYAEDGRESTEERRNRRSGSSKRRAQA